MQATEILEALQEAGATARVDGSNLLVEPRKCVPAALVPEIKEHKAEIMQHIAKTALPGRLDSDAEQTLLRLLAGSRWISAAHNAWVEGKPDAPTDERFSTALAAWDLLERKLRNEFGYEGCVYGPSQQCPKDAPVMCDACMQGVNLR